MTEVPRKLFDAFEQSAAIWNVSEAVAEEKGDERRRFLDHIALHSLEHDNIELITKIGKGDFHRGAKLLKENI
jgi:hypothetical protein